MEALWYNGFKGGESMSKRKIKKITKRFMEILNVQTAGGLLKKAIIFMMQEMDFVKIVQQIINKHMENIKYLTY